MRTFYHLSTTDARRSILENGLLPKSKRKKSPNGIGYSNKIFLFSDINDIPFSFVSHNGAIDIWEVMVPEDVKVSKDPFAEKDRHHTSWMVGKPIPPENLRRIKTQWHPIEYQGGFDDPIPEELA